MPNAIKMLQDDHNSARILFGQIQQVAAGQVDVEMKATLQLATMLATHTQLEKEFIYPLLAKVDSALAEAFDADHDEAKRLLIKIEEMSPGMELRDMVVELQTVVEAHVAKEEAELFPFLADKVGVVELEDLGLVMMSRQQELMKEGEDTAGAAETARVPGIHPKI